MSGTSADTLLVLNAGSSSLKFAVFQGAGAGPWAARARGLVEGLGTAPRLTVRDAAGGLLTRRDLGPEVDRVDPALAVLARWLREHYGDPRLAGVGHRVVHGGARFAAPLRLSPGVREQLQALVPLAPLHQPHNLAAMDAMARQLPGVPQVACFDTSFHRGQPPVAQLVPLPAAIRERGVQRYGFHGLSCEYIAGRLPVVAPELAAGRVIVAHLGNGASLCALASGSSVDSTFGFTALDGLCMGTRPGALDPGVVLYLVQQLGMSPAELERLLYQESGLLGISGLSNDMRDLLASDAPAARLAVDYFVYRAVREIGGLAAVLGGLDGLVFTAGVGENSAEIRARIAAGCAWLGLQLDPEANRGSQLRISRPASLVSAWVIPTNEELVIARHTARVLGLGSVPG